MRSMENRHRRVLGLNFDAQVSGNFSRPPKARTASVHMPQRGMNQMSVANVYCL
jgi:hypothetical protein